MGDDRSVGRVPGFGRGRDASRPIGAMAGNKKRLPRIAFEAIFSLEETSEAIQRASVFPPVLITLFEQGGNCGPDGIRTRDLGLDRAAC